MYYSNSSIVAIDSRTGGQLDLPPLPRDWPRSIHGRLVDELMRRGAEVIVFDIHFGREKDPGADQALVEARVHDLGAALVLLDGLDEVLVHLTPGAGQGFTRELWRILPPSLFRRGRKERAEAGMSNSIQ